MPFNGQGSFATLYNWQTDAANGLNISSSRMQGQDADFATGLSLCMTKDGQQTATANLPMGGFTLTNMANATAQGNPINVADFQNGTPILLGTVSGTDTITAAAAIAPAAYKKGQTWRFIAAGPNATTNVTLNANGLGPVNVKKLGANALAIGDIQNGQVVDVTYDGTNFQIKTPNFGVLPGRLLNVQIFTASGTYTPTAGANSALVCACGGGGSGGGAPTTNGSQFSGGSGGNGGASGSAWISGGLSVQTVTIGAGGAPAVGANGNSGGATSFGALLVAPGGPGGISHIEAAGSSGFLSNSNVLGTPCSGSALILSNSPGGAGQPGIFLGTGASGTSFIVGGNGGDSLYGAGAGQSSVGVGLSAAGFGGGGGGAALGESQSAVSGGSGTAGVLIVYEYS